MNADSSKHSASARAGNAAPPRYTQRRSAAPSIGAEAALRSCLQIPAWSIFEIQNLKGAPTLNIVQQRIDVLTDVVIPRPFAEAFGDGVVIAQRGGGDLGEVVRVEFHRAAV